MENDSENPNVQGTWGNSMLARAKSIFNAFPVVGHLTECDLKDHLNALPEVLVNLVWSTLPFWLGAIVLYATSQAYDLYDLAKARSPQKVCHNIAVALDQNTKSPFYQRIKRLGVATEGRFNETLTQATFIESLMPYNPKDLEPSLRPQDRESLVRRS